MRAMSFGGGGADASVGTASGMPKNEKLQIAFKGYQSVDIHQRRA
jgi:hypothetical protein